VLRHTRIEAELAVRNACVRRAPVGLRLLRRKQRGTAERVVDTEVVARRVVVRRRRNTEIRAGENAEAGNAGSLILKARARGSTWQQLAISLPHIPVGYYRIILLSEELRIVLAGQIDGFLDRQCGAFLRTRDGPKNQQKSRDQSQASEKRAQARTHMHRCISGMSFNESVTALPQYG
jgi:hypothetical protein